MKNRAAAHPQVFETTQSPSPENLDVKNLFRAIVVQHGDKCISRPAGTAVLPASIPPDKTSVVRVGPTATLFALSNASLAKMDMMVSFGVVFVFVLLLWHAPSVTAPTACASL